MTQFLIVEPVSSPPLEVFLAEVFLSKSKLKYQLPRFPLLVGSLIIVTLLTALSGLWHYQYEVAHQVSGLPIARQNAPAGAQISSKAGTAVTAAPNIGQPAASNTVGSGTPRSNIDRNSNAASAPASVNSSGIQQLSHISTQTANVSVNLSINGQGKGSVQLASGSNQCSVLTQALADGLISNLDMRYSSEYQTEAVYVIDGVGDPGAVWWTYKVNGHAPPYGCAYISAHSGDSVNWQYIKK